MKQLTTLITILLLLLSGSTQIMHAEATQETDNSFKISNQAISTIIEELKKKSPAMNPLDIERGVRQVALLWQRSDGDAKAFYQFCSQNYLQDKKEKVLVFKKISRNFESLWGHFNQIRQDLQWDLTVDQGTVHKIDNLFSGYSAGAHLGEDFFKNRIAFIIALNFPYYSLEEKSKRSSSWTRQDWAFARAGDLYTSRVPARKIQAFSKISANAEIYIAQYNIFAGQLVNKKKEQLFPKEMRLLSHWNLRDEIKANYGQKRGLEKQGMIYQVMKRIIDQSIPFQVINNPNYTWNPYSNTLYKDGKVVEFRQEPDTRYLHLLENFRKLKQMDQFYPAGMNTYIKRKFSGEMEIAQEEVEELFMKLLSAPQVKKVARLIRKRLGRKLQVTDLWYNGFKPKTALPADKLDAITKKRYPNAAAFKADLDNILIKLGFDRQKSAAIAAQIAVDPARGSGHAAGAVMKQQKSRLRTRIGKNGMDYKGYNIAVHEFGHNVEQTISLHDVDYYLLNGVPSTAFTEALAFIFQARDLELLGQHEPDSKRSHLNTLSIFWNVYESMGVSLVDMRVWKWLYANPDANVKQVKQAVIKISKDVWNRYFAKFLGGKDEPILGIYSHMIGYPLYLSAYSYGYLINFQLEQHLKGKDFAKEILRIYSIGRLIPQVWMKQAVGSEISVDPLLKAVDSAVKVIR